MPCPVLQGGHLHTIHRRSSIYVQGRAFSQSLTHVEAGNFSFMFSTSCRPRSLFTRSSASRFRKVFSDDLSHVPDSVRATSLGGDDVSTILRRSRTNMDRSSWTSVDVSACTEAFSDDWMLLISASGVHSACVFFHRSILLTVFIMAVLD